MKEKFSYEKTQFAGLCHIVRHPIIDERGLFERLFCIDEVEPWEGRKIIQINQTLTKACGTIRGLHFQFPPNAECKYVTCIRGAVFDVAVDLRQNSKTYGQWFGCKLTSVARNALIIPEGFAHGFQTLENDVSMLYFHSEPYKKELESGIHPLDKDLAITWPISTSFLSERDKRLELFAEFKGILL